MAPPKNIDLKVPKYSQTSFHVFAYKDGFKNFCNDVVYANKNVDVQITRDVEILRHLCHRKLVDIGSRCTKYATPTDKKNRVKKAEIAMGFPKDYQDLVHDFTLSEPVDMDEVIHTLFKALSSNSLTLW
jgi:hypothetical protein